MAAAPGNIVVFRIGLELGAKAKSSRYYKFSDAQSKHFEDLMRANGLGAIRTSVLRRQVM